MVTRFGDGCSFLISMIRSEERATRVVTDLELGSYIRKRKHFKVTQLEIAGALGWRKEVIMQYESGVPNSAPSPEQLKLMDSAIDIVVAARAKEFAAAV